MATNESLTDDEWTEVQNDLREHLDDFRLSYESDSNKNEKVDETDDHIVFADGLGHELNAIANMTGVDRDALSARMHDEARSRTDYNWSVSDPVVIIK